MRIFITGISGFLGSRMAEYWTAAGHGVSGATRRPSVRGVVPFELGSPLAAGVLDGYDVVIHGAYDRDGGIERNVEGTKRVCIAGEKAGVPRQIFLSSYAARPDTTATYGRMKYELERFFLERGHTVVRPGLVIGNGGMFGRNLEQILRWRVIPLLDGGRDLLAVLSIGDFTRAMDALLYRPEMRTANLFLPELVSMRKLAESVAQATGRRPVFFSVPLKPAVLFLAAIEKLRLPFPARADNVRSLKQSLPGFHRSDLAALVAKPIPLDSAVKAALSDRTARASAP